MQKLDIGLRVVTENTVVISISGEMNIYNANQLKQEFERHIGAGMKIFILNFANMTMIDSAGIGVMFTILTRVKKIPGEVKVVQARENVKKLFEITKVNRFFALIDTEEEALATLV